MFTFFLLSQSAVTLFIASLFPSIYGAASERMFTSRCLCAIIRQSRITHSLHRCPPLRFLFFLIVFAATCFTVFKSRGILQEVSHLVCTAVCRMHTAVHTFSSFAHGAGKGPFQTGLRSLIGDDIKLDQNQTKQLCIFPIS